MGETVRHGGQCEMRPNVYASLWLHYTYSGPMRAGIRDLKTHLSAYLECVKRGESLDITDRGRVIAHVIPATAAAIPAELIERMAKGQITWSGTRLEAKMPSTRLHGSGPTLAEIVSEQRDSGEA